MKILTFLLTAAVFAATKMYGLNSTGTTSTDQVITVTGGAYDLTFETSWACDDNPRSSAPGRVELWQDGNFLGRVLGTAYRTEGPAASATVGTVSDVSGYVVVYCPDSTPADGMVTATWHLTGLADGDYTLRFFRYSTYSTPVRATTVWTNTYFVGGGSPTPPVIPPVIEPPDPPEPEPPVIPPQPTQYSLATSADSGGSVTPGGVYPAGSVVTVTAVADAAHYFGGWTGDAAGLAPNATVTIDRDRAVFASFIPKGTQSITFAPLPNLPPGAPPQSLSASSSSGLPVTFSVASGPATISGNVLTLTGPGSVTVTATQDGDGTFLPAVPVSRTFTTTAAPAIVRVHTSTRTLLGNASPNAHYVLPTLP